MNIQCRHCRREHTRVGWESLVLVGWFGAVFAGTTARAIELRRCVCGQKVGRDTVLPVGVA